MLTTAVFGVNLEVVEWMAEWPSTFSLKYYQQHVKQQNKTKTTISR